MLNGETALPPELHNLTPVQVGVWDVEELTKLLFL